MSRQRQKGTTFERQIADHLAWRLRDDRIDRMPLHGAHDRGDIAGVRCAAGKVVIECKQYGGRLQPGPWVEEAHVEAGNADAAVGVVIAKRRGTTNPDDQFALMTVRDLVALIGGVA